jgi:hypothetical protein
MFYIVQAFVLARSGDTNAALCASTSVLDTDATDFTVSHRFCIEK